MVCWPELLSCVLAKCYIFSYLAKPYTHYLHSWLHGEPGATVCDVSPIATAKPHPQDSETLPLTTQDDVIATDDDVMTEYLSVKVILTETANSKFQARFSRSVKMF